MKSAQGISAGQYSLAILADYETKNQQGNIRVSRNRRPARQKPSPAPSNTLTLINVEELTSGPITSPKPSVVAHTSHAQKLESHHLSFRGDRLPLDNLEPKAREYYRYLLVNYGYFVAENYVNLVSKEEYKNRPPILKDSYEDLDGEDLEFTEFEV